MAEAVTRTILFYQIEFNCHSGKNLGRTKTVCRPRYKLPTADCYIATSCPLLCATSWPLLQCYMLHVAHCPLTTMQKLVKRKKCTLLLRYIHVFKYMCTASVEDLGWEWNLQSPSLCLGNKVLGFPKLGWLLKLDKEGLFGIKNLDVCPNWVGN